jgi:hypothetical protein
MAAGLRPNSNFNQNKTDSGIPRDSIRSDTTLTTEVAEPHADASAELGNSDQIMPAEVRPFDAERSLRYFFSQNLNCRYVESSPMSPFEPTQEHLRSSNTFVVGPGADAIYEEMMSTEFSALRCDTILFNANRIDKSSYGYHFNRVMDKLSQIGFVVSFEAERGTARRAVSFDTLQANEKRYRAEQDLTYVNFSDLLKGVQYEPHNTGDGVIYLAIGQRCFREAQLSAVTLIRHNSDQQVTIFSDQPEGEVPVEYSFISANRSPFKLKIEAMKRSPYARTVFLDSDTIVCGSLRRLFETLQSVDFGICQGSAFHYESGQLILDNYHNSDQLNTGVIAFRNVAAVRAVLGVWSEAMARRPDNEIGIGHFADQYHFNVFVKSSPEFRAMNWHVLDNRIWNLRTYALGQAIKDDLIRDTIIVHGKKWEARRFWSVDTDKISGIATS